MVVVFLSALAFTVGVVVGRDRVDAASDAPGDAAARPAGASRELPRLVIVGEPEEAPTAGALDEVTYPGRLGSAGPAEEQLRGLPLFRPRTASSEPQPAPAPDRKPAPVAETPEEAPEELRAALPPTAVEPPPAKAGGDAAPPAGGDPYTVQVAALRAADAAERFAVRLQSKGFPAYVVEPSPEGPVAVYRVRVGRYADHGEAERIRLRLVQEEQLSPWITR